MKHKVLVVGANGLIGSHFTRLLNCYHNDELSVNGISQEDIDLSHINGKSLLNELISNYKPSAVIVLAATKRQLGDSKEILEINNKITDNIVEALSKYKLHTIYLSSCAVYGEKNNQIQLTENAQLDPTSFYGEHKIYSEYKYRESIDCANLLVLRPPLIYGEYSNGYNPAGFIESAVRNKTINLWGNGEEVREFIHVHDAASFLINSIKGSLTGTFNLVSGESYSYREMACLISKLIPVRVNERSRTSIFVNHSYKQHQTVASTLDSTFLRPTSYINATLIRHKLNNESI